MNIFHFAIIAFFVAIFSGCGYKADPYYSAKAHGNSSLGASFALVENFGNQQTISLVLSQNFLQDTKSPPQNTRIVLLDSNVPICGIA